MYLLDIRAHTTVAAEDFRLLTGEPRTMTDRSTVATTTIRELGRVYII